MVNVDVKRCIGCGICVPFCPVNAIFLTEEKASVNQYECVECGVCTRNVCPMDALYSTEITSARLIRQISNPTLKKVTGLPGRGTEEVKTNDVSGRIKRGEIGLCIDVGRPSVGTSLKDVEMITTTLAKAGVQFETNNPCTELMSNKETGEFSGDILDERVLSIIIECKIRLHQAMPVLEALRSVEKQINTVFSVGLICRVDEDDSIPVISILEQMNIPFRPNAKVNVGLGRPLLDV